MQYASKENEYFCFEDMAQLSESPFVSTLSHPSDLILKFVFTCYYSGQVWALNIHECSNKFEFGLQLKKISQALKIKKISAGLGVKAYYDAIYRIQL